MVVEAATGFTERALLAQARELAVRFRERLAGEVTAGEARFPRHNLDELIAAGFLLLAVPAAAGGLDVSLAAYCALTEELATGSPATALLLAMPVGLVGWLRYPAEQVPEPHRAAYREQCAWVYDELRAGHVFAAGNSESGISDIMLSQTEATPDGNGAWRLSGRKVFGSWGRHSHWLFSSARVPAGALSDGAEVEFFFVRNDAPGVHWAEDWNSFGMGETESHSFELRDAPAHGPVGFPGFWRAPLPLDFVVLGFTAVALGCVRGLLAPLLAGAGRLGPGARAQLAALTARYEAARAYLIETARQAGSVGDAPQRARALRAKTHVTRECTQLAAELFAFGSGSALAANGLPAKYLRDVFAGTGLRPPYKAALDAWGDGLDTWQPPAGA